MLIRSGMGMQMSGSVGGVVASHNAGGAYLRNRSVPTNPNSARQQLVRSGMAAAGAAWSALSSAEREAWEGYASETPVTNRLGDTITLSGWNMFCRTFLFFTAAGEIAELPSAAPTVPGLISQGEWTVTLQETDGLTFSGIDISTTGPYIVSMSPALSPGVTYCRGPFTAFLTGMWMSEGLNGVATAGNQSINRYGLPIEGERRCLRVQASSADGRLASPRIVDVVVAAPTP